MSRFKPRCLPDHAPFDPELGPDWVWHWANKRVENGQHRSLGRDGPEVYRAIALVRAMRSHGLDSHDLLALRRKDPSLVSAYELRVLGGRRSLLELECRILARQSDSLIAVEMDFDPHVIKAYCSLFLRVRSHLSALQYILHRVLKIDQDTGPLEHQFVMLAANQFGPPAIDPLLDWYDHRSELHDLKTNIGRMRESIELLYEGQLLPNSKKTNIVMCRWLAVHTKAERDLARHCSAQHVVSKNMLQMIAETFGQCDATPRQQRSVSDVPQHPAQQRNSNTSAMHQVATI